MKAPRVVAVIQARMGSSRLPGKTMMDLAGTPLLDRLLRQLSGATTLAEVVVATSVDPADDAIERFAVGRGFRVVRGPEQDVLSRYVIAAEAADADIVVRLTADCPLHSADTVDEVVAAFLEARADYACNTNPYTRPDGQDVEVFTRRVLGQAAAEAKDGPDREHVTLWMRRSTDVVRLDVLHPPPHQASRRWSVDHPDDLEFARTVWTCLNQRGPGPFKFEEIMSAVIESGAVQGKPPTWLKAQEAAGRKREEFLVG
jgi:spore coat polysaccharide biosynthesis protein SpsF (cytidylyltransferase family)